jgi:site-specific DNA recombinase
MRVALYVRVSSEAQAARGTIGSQLEVLASRVAAEGHEVVATYTDDGYSGARLDRPGLDALRDAAEGGAFESLWCLSPDRLARSFPYQVLILDELARLGVPVVFTDSPPIDDDPQARLLIQMQGVIAEYERAKITERHRRGKLYRVRAGEAIFWKVPYGYRRVARSDTGPARLEIYEPEAVVVRRIFAEYTSGTSLRQIIRHLYQDGIPTSTGKPLWASSTINGLIRNPTFKGKAAWYRHEYTPSAGGRSRRRARPEEEWVEVAVPAIINDEIFAAAQAVGRDNSAFSPRKTTPGLWLLRGLVVCGRCGVKAHVQPMRSRNGNTNRYYCCSYHDPIKAGGQDKRCTERRIRADELDAFVFDQIRTVLARPDVLLAGQDALAGREPPSGDEILTAQLEKLTRRVEQADAERRRIADLYQANLITTDELRRRAKEVTARRTKLQAEHAELTARHHELAGKNRLRHRLGDFAAKTAAGLDRLDFDGRQRLLRLIIEEVRITGWQVEIRLRIPLDTGPTDTDSRSRDNPKNPSPTKNSRRPPNRRAAVSTDLGLRSAGGVQPFLLPPALGGVGLGVHQVHAEHRARPGQLMVGVGRAVVDVQDLGYTSAGDR